MMFMSLIRKRRTIRRFQAKPVEPEKMDLLAEAALRAPSSRGLRPWEFIFVTDPSLLEKLSRAKSYGSSHLKDAPLAIAVCADPARCDVWIEDASIASTFIQLAAESLGLGNCWIQIRERRYDDTKTSQECVSEILNIPPNLRVASLIAVGYADEEKSPHPKEELLYEKLHFDRYGKPYTKP